MKTTRTAIALATLTTIMSIQTSTAKNRVKYKAPSYKAEMIMDVGAIVKPLPKASKSQQGFVTDGRYGFVLYDKGSCAVVDLNDKSIVDKFIMDGAEDTHCNNAGFGREKFSKSSEFPLMYISECKGEHRCFVEDVSLNGSRLVQTIYFTGSGYTGSFDWFLDTRRGYIYTYGTSGKKQKTIKRFRLPKLKDSDTDGKVFLTDDDVMAEGTFSINVYQGSALDCKRNILYAPDGFNPHPLLLHVIDLNTWQEVDCIDLKTLGIEHEPEGVCVIKDKLYMTLNHKLGKIYTLDLSL